jgi:hypothetical protein
MEFYLEDDTQNNTESSDEPKDYEGYDEWLAEIDRLYEGVPRIFWSQGEETGRN